MRSKPAPDPNRQLMIKTKACQRLKKDVEFYKNEVKENEAKLAQMRANNRDPYDIKKFEEVLGESYMMIPDSSKRLKQSLDDLAQFLKVRKDDLDKESEWWSESHAILERSGCGDGEGFGKEEGERVATTSLEGLKEGEAF
mmetsp:Transcript_3268/g.4196  ORF Transcript_3268/g.4196 Transcript_3268/m.4196 type:complete len:141 (+) Transcript_3268:223-645(+)|eukprot:CAMPEP_0172490536 /NCGR_PEP_ID=MMETSP1066-20121228/21000_1 /TAXON_ID=671091 /ORGANISM="Coscinodiscus wailesii, Strain CCMP2513" /LENGTH=140 /DNA_ID=CAMNT_0013259051 /DNA_START=139 /DNA_END=561 /DNA_ORIENTATION=+